MLQPTLNAPPIQVTHSEWHRGMLRRHRDDDPERLHAGRLARRELSAVEECAAALERIAERDGLIEAFQHLDPDLVMARAREADERPERGPLHGLPLGVKDALDTVDFPTEYGSPIYAGHRPAKDAQVVARAREAGAIVAGKTVSTEFCAAPPGKTRNPHHPGCTPGGSSSGSAAAVADGMIPAALGTQTAGSVIRPAAFCGCVGFKPTFNLLSRRGLKPTSYSLDTVGVFTRRVELAAYIVGALSGQALVPPEQPAAPRLGVCVTPHWGHADPATHALFAREVARLASAGATVRPFDLPPHFDEIDEVQRTIWDFELASCLATEYHEHRGMLREPLPTQIERGLARSPERFFDALRYTARCRRHLDELMCGIDAIIAPSAVGEAPRGLEATGDPIFNMLWTLFRTPCVHVPTATGPRGLPMGIQVVGRENDDATALSVARWIEAKLPVEPLAR